MNDPALAKTQGTEIPGGRPATVEAAGAGGVERRRLAIPVRHEHPVRGELAIRLVDGAVAGGENHGVPGAALIVDDRAGALPVATGHAEEDLAGEVEDRAAARPGLAGHAAATPGPGPRRGLDARRRQVARLGRG